MLYVSQFLPTNAELASHDSKFFVTPSVVGQEMEELRYKGLVEGSGDGAKLTDKGRKLITVVMCGGAFDIIHPGHVETLEQAKELGDVLVVSVARDSTFERNKKRKPEHGEALRRLLVSAIRVVDLAVLGSETDILETVEILKPDVIALGYDQFHDEEKISQEVKRRGLNVKVVRLKSSNPDIKTSLILNRDRTNLAGF